MSNTKTKTDYSSAAAFEEFAQTGVLPSPDGVFDAINQPAFREGITADMKALMVLLASNGYAPTPRTALALYGLSFVAATVAGRDVESHGAEAVKEQEDGIAAVRGLLQSIGKEGLSLDNLPGVEPARA
jgi:hypothetical protein